MFSNIKKIRNLYDNMPLPIRASFWFTICTILQKGISVITLPLFTDLLSTDEYGKVSVFITWENIFILVTSLSLSSGIFNTAMIDYENERNKVVSTYLGLSSLITLVFYLFFFLNPQPWVIICGIEKKYIHLIFLHLLLAPAYNLWLALNRFEYKYKKIVIFTFLFSLFVPLISYIFVKNSDNHADSRIVSMAIVESIFYLILFCLIFIKGKTFFNKDFWKMAIIVNVPLIPHFLSGNILNQSDRLMINSMVGSSEAGIYSVAYSISVLIQLFIGNINVSIIPWLYNKIKNNDTSNVSSIINYITLIVSVGIFMFMLFVPECLKFLTAPDYYPAINIIPTLLVSTFFIYLYNLFSNIELYYKKSIYITVASCLSAFLNILLNYYAIPLYGYVAAAYTTLISYCRYSVLHYIFMIHICKNSCSNIFNIRFLIINSILLIVLSIFISQIYTHIILRYSLLFILLILVFLFRNKLKDLLTLIKQRG